ncbi:MAG: hypothetical protein NUV45_10815 [Tepidanaerobacteraceae bacterium]|nr:hypothetical protein [Tepidanaerobacteraceae bacterium]
MIELENFLPRIPKPVKPIKPVDSPFQQNNQFSAVRPEKKETLASWLIESFRRGIYSVPKIGGQLLIQSGIVLAVNLIFWPIKTWQLPGPIAFFVTAIIFLTATYNDIIPKTIYWVIVFTFGKRLFLKIKNQGFANAISPIKQIVPEFKRAYLTLQEKAYSLLLTGGGAGLIVANNFASYSRFPEARNKIDKYFVVLVISFAVSYVMGESRKNWMFKFARLASKDISRIMKRPYTYTDDHTYILLSGFVAGLLFDAPLVLFKLMYGGYILGGALMAVAVLMPLALRQRETK